MLADSSWSHGLPLAQQAFLGLSSGSANLQPGLRDVEEQCHDCLPAIHHPLSCGGSNQIAEACLQQPPITHGEAGTHVPSLYITPPRPNRQADQVPQNPFCIGSITDRLLKVSHPYTALTEPISCATIQPLAKEQLPISGFKHQRWPMASSSLLSPLLDPSAACCTSADTTSDDQHYQGGLWINRQHTASFRPAHLPPAALRCRSSTGTSHMCARPQLHEVKAHVTSRDPRRQACQRTAISPEASATSSEVSLFMSHIHLSQQQCCTC